MIDRNYSPPFNNYSTKWRWVLVIFNDYEMIYSFSINHTSSTVVQIFSWVWKFAKSCQLQVDECPINRATCYEDVNFAKL